MEVGKKYRHTKTGVIFECLLVDGIWVCLKTKGQIPFITEYAHFYEEYHEPKIEEHVFLLTRDTENQGVLFWRTPRSKFYPLLAKVKLTITDDKATSIEIIKEP